MCFSASASFTAGAGLLVIGAIAISQSKSIPQRVLAAIPLIFSVQQLSEGVLWLSLSHAAYAHWQHLSMYVFLVFGQAVWPAFIPFVILLFEKDRVRKKILRVLLAAGILTFLYFSCCLLFYHAEATMEGHHIKYQLDFPPAVKWISGLIYILAAVFSPFVSSLKPLRFLGWMLLVSYLVSRLLYMEYIISVWCYFAAILSLFVLVIIRQLKKISPAPDFGTDPRLPDR